MKNRGTTALIALFFAGLVGLWVADWSQTPSAVDLARQRGRILAGLVNLRPDDLRKIEIDGGPDAPALVFERRAGRRWQMTAPLDVAANPSLVEGLAFRLKELTRKPEATTLTGDPATYGLAPASKTVRLWGAATDAPVALLELGAVNLDRRFVRAGAAGIEVVPAEGLDVVDLPPVRWRDRELFRVPTFEVDAVALKRPEHDLKFERGVDAWRIIEPIRTLAEESKIEGLVASIGSLRITDPAQYVADDVPATDHARFGLDQPSLTITVSSGRGDASRPSQSLEVGKPLEGQPERRYARMTNQNDVVALDARVLNELIKAAANEFRTAKVADIAPNRATRFRIKAGDAPFEVTRSGNTWFVVRPTPGRADPKAVQEFFQALEGLRTRLYLPPSGATENLAGLEDPAEVIQVWQAADPRVAAPTSPTTEPPSADDPPTFTLKLGNHDAGKKIVYAQTEGDTSILALPEAMTANLFKTSWAFRDRLILAEPTDQIERIKFDGLGKQVTIHAPVVKIDLFKNAAVGWWLSEPVAAPADNPSVAKLLKLLAAFRVDGFAAENPPSLAPFGLANPSLQITWSVPAALPPSPVPTPPASDSSTGQLRFDEQTLLIGGPVAERRSMRYAMLAGRPLVFMLGGETLATLDAEWHTHQALKFDPAAIRQIHVTWPGSSWAADLHRTDQTWEIIGPMDLPDFDPTAADAIVRAASRLTTPRYLQYTGAIPPTIGLTPPRLMIKFTGEPGTEPVELALGVPADAQQGYAATPASRPGAVFLAEISPFLPWLAIQPPLRDGLPEDVFLRDTPAPPASEAIDRPGQSGEQPR